MALYISFYQEAHTSGRGVPGKFISSQNALVVGGTAALVDIPSTAAIVEIVNPDAATYFAAGNASYGGSGAAGTFIYLPTGETRRYEIAHFRGGKIAYKTVV